MPRPSSQNHTRFAIARVNQGFSGRISQSANTVARIAIHPEVRDGPIGKNRRGAAAGRKFVRDRKNTISSFHSPVAL